MSCQSDVSLRKPHDPVREDQISCFPLYPGICLTLLSLCTGSSLAAEKCRPKSLDIVHCRVGQEVLSFSDGRILRLGPGDCVLCMDRPALVSLSAEECCEGIRLTVELPLLSKQPTALLAEAGMDGDFFFHKFSSRQAQESFSGNEQTEAIFAGFYDRPEAVRLPFWKLKAQELLFYLGMMTERPQDASFQYQSEQIRIVRCIHDQLIRNLDKRITIEDLSRQYLMNPTTLKSMFKSVYGTSLAAHVKEHRMEQAARLLSETDDSVAQIARAVGYESQSKFTTAFKDFYQILPSEYRKHR